MTVDHYIIKGRQVRMPEWECGMRVGVCPIRKSIKDKRPRDLVSVDLSNEKQIENLRDSD